jgi:hypothetical protein
MAASSNPRPYEKQNPYDKWIDVLYLAMIAVSIAGLIYIGLESQ